MKFTSILFRAKRNISLKPLIALVAAISSLWAFLPAYAHHPFEGRAPQTFTAIEALVSGLGHPVIGIDHLLFLICIGLVSTLSIKRWLPLLLLSGFTGTLTSLYLPGGIPGVEFIIGLSLLFASLICYGLINPLFILPLIFFHGFALGEEIIGAEPTPLIFYSLGLILIQGLIICLSVGLMKKLVKYKSTLVTLFMGISVVFAFRAVLDVV